MDIFFIIHMVVVLQNTFVSYSLVCNFTGYWCKMNVFADSLAFTERSDISTV